MQGPNKDSCDLLVLTELYQDVIDNSGEPPLSVPDCLVWAADVNGDGKITAADVLKLTQYVTSQPGATLNCQ